MRHRIKLSRYPWLILALGCGPTAAGDGLETTSGPASSETGATSTPTTTGASSSSAAHTLTGDTTTSTGGASEAATGPAGTTTGTTTDDPSGGPCGFICPGTESDPDPCRGAPAPEQDDELSSRLTLCDVFKQNCPEGEKCAPAAECEGDSWNTTTCAPVTGDRKPGEPCTAPEGLSGKDDCAKGAYCWDVDEATKQGICVEMCTGSEATPVCSNEADFSCAVVNDGILNLCLPACDPLAQDCAGDDLCLLVGQTFVCVLDASDEGGQLFGACEFANGCDKGLLCLNPSGATECDPDSGGCCLPLCDLSDPDATCPGAGQSCVSLYEEGMAPPEFTNVGTCVLPP